MENKALWYAPYEKTPYGSILALFGLYLEEEKRYHHQTLGSSSPTYTMIIIKKGREACNMPLR